MKIYVLFSVVLVLQTFLAQAQTQESNAEVLNPYTTEKVATTTKKVANNTLEFDVNTPPSIYDGAYKRNVHLERIALPLEHVREADVMWSKRIWREIDTRQKLNDVFVNQHQPFISVLLEIIQQNDHIQIFADESFETVLSKTELAQRLNQTDTIEIYNFDTDAYEQQVVKNEVNLEAFNTFRLKEDWLFDSKASKMRARIIGIAPVRDVLDPITGQIRGQENLFWIHYESIRPLLAKYEAYNEQNNAHTLSWTDMLDMRRFASVITKEANNRNIRIKDYATGRAALIEAERVDNEMRDFEFGLWSY